MPCSSSIRPDGTSRSRLVVPPNITLVALPPKCPELNPVENVWQFMRDNWLSNRIFTSYTDLSSTIVVTLGTSSSISHGPSCLSASATGHTGPDHRDVVLGADSTGIPLNFVS